MAAEKWHVTETTYHLEDTDLEKFGYVVSRPNDGDVALVKHKVDGQLIAAAPELRQALQNILRHYESGTITLSQAENITLFKSVLAARDIDLAVKLLTSLDTGG